MTRTCPRCGSEVLDGTTATAPVDCVRCRHLTTDDAPTIAARACDWLHPDDAAELRRRVAAHGGRLILATDERNYLNELRAELLDAPFYLEAHAVRGPHSAAVTAHLRSARRHIVAALGDVRRMRGMP